MTDPVDWRSSRLKRFEAAAIGALGYPLIAALGGTYRWTVQGRHVLERIEASGRKPVIAVWHGRILASICFFARQGVAVIISEHFDGEWIARIVARLGYETARGSTTRGSRKALLQLTREMRMGRAVAITIDGPRGPARVAQPGAAWLAKVTGNPVVPVHIEASRYWTLPSWDRTQIPRPFARLGVAIGDPIEIPGDSDDGQMEQARAGLESALVTLEQRALALIGRAAEGTGPAAGRGL